MESSSIQRAGSSRGTRPSRVRARCTDFSARVNIESAEIAGFVWTFDPSVRNVLEGPVCELLSGEKPLACHRLKRTRVREVWQVEAPLPCFVKRYLSPTIGVGIRARLRGSKARREAESARALADLGVETVHTLAVGERRGPGVSLESILVTEAIVHDGDLLERLSEPAADASARRRLLVRLGRYLAMLHDAGVAAPDLHAENLLVRAGPRAGFSLIDVDGVSLAGSLARAQREVSLALILHSLRDATSRSDRVRVLRAYLDASGVIAHERLSWRDGVDAAWDAERRVLLRSATRRALRVGSRFDQMCDAEKNFFWRRRFTRECAERAISGHMEAVETGRGTFLKRSRRVRISVQEVAGADCRFVVKEIFDTTMRSLLQNTLTGSRGRRAWVGGHALAIRDFATPETVALLEKKRHGFVAENLLVTVALDGWESLADHFHQRYVVRPATPSSLREKRTLLALVGKTLRRLHDERVHHHDLSARNLFVDATRTPTSLAILDLESLRRFSWLTRGRKATHLAQVLETVGDTHWSDAYRVLRAYGIRDARERRRWLRRVAAQSRRRARRRETRRIRRERDLRSRGAIAP